MAVIGEMRNLTIGSSTYTIPVYSLPIATASILGGIKVGSGLSIDASTGVLTATGISITIDSAMSDTSTNTVQNKVIKAYVDSLGESMPNVASLEYSEISISDHPTTTIYTVTSNTTSVTGVQSSTTTASKVTVGTATSDYGVTDAGSGSFTQGSFSGGSGSFSATVTSHVLSFSHTHTAATHGSDSHSHTAPTLGSKVPTVSATDVTVPIKATSATTVPIKATDSVVVITSGVHNINDSGHSHTVFYSNPEIIIQ